VLSADTARATDAGPPVASPAAPRRAARARPERGAALLWLLAALAAAYLALPIANLLLVEPWGSLGAALADPLATGALATSLVSATIATLLIAAGGVPLAYVLAHWRFRLRPLVTLLVYVPLVFPAVVSGIVQLLVYGPYGPIGAFWARRGLELDGTLAGVVLAQTFVAAPFAVVAARAAFEAVDPATERVAATLGATRWRVFWTVSLPQAAGGVVAGLILTWLRAMGEFGATAVLAYHPYTLPVYIYVQLTGLGTAAALPLALLALGACVLAIGAAMLATARSRVPGMRP
jgi:molybdate/tungstate transport system permease protein